MAYAYFSEMFVNACGLEPYVYQERLAAMDEFPILLKVETGLGKTAGAILAWVWRRRFAGQDIRMRTPRRLVYCLPQRSLVSQTAKEVERWLDNLGLSDELRKNAPIGTGTESVTSKYPIKGNDRSIAARDSVMGLLDDSGDVDAAPSGGPIGLRVLMGGDLDRDWDRFPEMDQIMIGTQDQLLSRALNRGYATSRYRWPIHYSLINNDVQWIIDECQLMGSGLATTTQLQAFREDLGTFGTARTMWMSATLEKSWLATIDYASRVEQAQVFALRPIETAEMEIQKRLNAHKPVEIADLKLDKKLAAHPEQYAKQLGSMIKEVHRSGTLTLIVVNRVNRAQEIMRELLKTKFAGAPRLILVHSQFRAAERSHIQSQIDEVKNGDQDAIIVATQAVEAGIDLSARTLITEIAPWSSLIQRFGRCNRKGEAPSDGLGEARVIIIDAIDLDVDVARPYSPDDLRVAKNAIRELTDAAPANLPNIELAYTWGPVLRRKDVLDWFDTSADLSGYDVDVSPYIRETQDLDVQVLWRDIVDGLPSEDDFQEGELCRVSIGRFRDYLKKKVQNVQRSCFKWNHLDGIWMTVDLEEGGRPRPGQVYCLDSTFGGYDNVLGFVPDYVGTVSSLYTSAHMTLDAIGQDESSVTDGFVTLGAHTKRVVQALKELVAMLPEIDERDALIEAALWHDIGKAHPIFQMKLLGHLGDPDFLDCPQVIYAKAPRAAGGGPQGSGQIDSLISEALGQETAQDRSNQEVLEQVESSERIDPTSLARSDDGIADRKIQERARFFRHELASAIAYLETHVRGQELSYEDRRRRNLVAYLIAAHHGKVRASIRSFPGEPTPKGLTLFARGLWDGDRLLACSQGCDIKDFEAAANLHAPDLSQAIELHMDWMLMGSDPDVGQGSFAERALQLLESYGPFKLAWLESILRIGDWRGSAVGGEGN